jgi:mxaJ protein
MSSGCLKALTLAALLAVGGAAEARELRVCADPNNLPFSNDKGEGFENRIVEIVAKDLGARVSYTWWAQRFGFLRNTLNAGVCDLVPGIAGGQGLLLTFPPYYRSSYVFVTRASEAPVASLADPRLKTLRVGVQLVGDNGSNTPPAEALARRGVIANVRGYSVVGDYRQPDPPAAIITAVAKGEIDVAIAWGPMAGYFAARQAVPLQVTPLAEAESEGLPMAFDISMGLRRDEGALRQEIEAALQRSKPEIDAVLAQYHVPRLDAGDPQ